MHDCIQQKTIGKLEEQATQHDKDIVSLFDRKVPNGYVKWVQMIVLILAVVSAGVAIDQTRASEDRAIEKGVQKKTEAIQKDFQDKFYAMQKEVLQRLTRIEAKLE